MLNRRQCVAALAAGLSAQPPQKFVVGFAPEMGGEGTEPRWWRACDECRRLGFRFVETNNTPLKLVEIYESKPALFKERMAQRNLTMAGFALATPMIEPARRREVIEGNLRVARFLKAIGGSYITHLFASESNPTVVGQKLPKNIIREGFKHFAATANQLGKRMLEETGIRIALHAEKGAVRAGVCDPIMDATDPRYFHFWADIGHLAGGGVDPLALLRKYRSRLIGTHLKDWDPNLETEFGGKREKGSFVMLGKGVVDFPGIIAYLLSTGFDGFNMVELRAQPDPTEEMKDYLTRRLGLRL